LDLLKFGVGGNAKLDKNIATFSLLSGYSCPGADKCYTKVVIDENDKRKIVDGKNQEFRCFSASQEVVYTNVYNSRLHNYNIILNIVKDKSITYLDRVIKIYELLVKSLPKLDKWAVMRLHVGGDIFSLEYFDALIMLANAFPSKIFYAYTKSIHFWIKRLDKIPNNFKLTASYGGKYDHLIDKYKLKSVKVIMSEEEAEMWNLEIDHDDTHAYEGEKDFALLLHGSQQKSSNASKSMSELKKKGWVGYNNKSKKKNMLNLAQYKDLRYYLINLNLELNLIKDMKKLEIISNYISFNNDGVIYTDVITKHGVTFLYNDAIYNCFMVTLPNSNISKWICNCDPHYTDIRLYSEKEVIIETAPIIEAKHEISEEDLNLLNSFCIHIENNTIIFNKKFIINNLPYIFDGETLLLKVDYKDLTVQEFEDMCAEVKLVPKYLIQKIFNYYNKHNKIEFKTGRSSAYSQLKEPMFKKNEIALYNGTENVIINNIDYSSVIKQWVYTSKNSNEIYHESSLTKTGIRENKNDKVRPDLISPYFLNTLGKLMRDNNDKYPELNYMTLPDKSFYQSLWRHLIAYSEQQLFGITEDFDDVDHLAAIAFNAMGLIHNREVNKLK
jgi:hypothetical protein